MINLNVGNCWDWDFLNEIIRMNDEECSGANIRTTSLYGSMPFMSASARSSDRLPSEVTGNPKPLMFQENLIEYVQRAQRHNIAIRYTLNQSCIGPMQDFAEYWKSSLSKSIKFLVHEAGVMEYTVTSPLIAELMLDQHPGLWVEVSTICEVDSPEKIERWYKIGAKGVCLKLDANRNIDLLRDLKNVCEELGIDIDLLANEFCLFGCPWRAECYNLSSHNSYRGPFDSYPFSRCNNIRLEDPAEWIRARFILPQWMEFYEKNFGISTFKVTGRTHPPSVVLPIVEKYMKGVAYGNLLDLWPTVARLGNTVEPKDGTYIDIGEVDKSRNTLLSGMCTNKECGACDLCARVFKQASRRPK